MSLLFSRLSKTEKNGKKKKSVWSGAGVPNALYSQLIIFLPLALSPPHLAASLLMDFFLHVHFHPFISRFSFLPLYLHP